MTFLLLYYITDRKQFPGNEPERRERLLEKIAEAARAGLAIERKRLNEILANRKKESVHPSR